MIKDVAPQESRLARAFPNDGRVPSNRIGSVRDRFTAKARTSAVPASWRAKPMNALVSEGIRRR